MSCYSSDSDKLNAVHGKGDPTLIIQYGPYMNWGSWNHNTTRITALVDALTKDGHVVKLQHDSKETSWEDHGDVSVLAPDGTVLATAKKAQHNSKYYERSEILAKLAKDALTALKKGKASGDSGKGTTTVAPDKPLKLQRSSSAEQSA